MPFINLYEILWQTKSWMSGSKASILLFIEQKERKEKGISAISIKPLEDSICDCLERFSFPITHRSIMSACHLKVCMEEYTYFGKKFIWIYLFPNFKKHFVSLTLELIIQVGNLSWTARFQTQLCVVTCNFPRLIHLFILRAIADVIRDRKKKCAWEHKNKEIIKSIIMNMRMRKEPQEQTGDISIQTMTMEGRTTTRGKRSRREDHPRGQGSCKCHGLVRFTLRIRSVNRKNYE